MIKKRPDNSIVYRLRVFVLAIIMIQTGLIVASLIFGGVLEQAKNNAFQGFYEKVNTRKEYLQREMKNRWTNIDPYVELIHDRMGSDSEDTIVQSTQTLLEMLRTTQVTGVYMILNDPGANTNRFPAVYIRDYDPLSNTEGTDDLYMVYGPSELSKKLRIPMDRTWQYHFQLQATNQNFFLKPMEAALETANTNYCGYWSEPFRLSPDDVEIITYSRPIFDNKGALKGVIGVEITLNYLSQFLPATEIQSQDSLGYLIARKAGENGALVPVVYGGALQRRVLNVEKPLDLTAVNSAHTVFKVPSRLGNEPIYASYGQMGLYLPNTPFEKDQWYLVGFVREDHLLGYVNRITQILQISVLMSIVLGAFGGTMLSNQMTEPITALVNQVLEHDQRKRFDFRATGFFELDQLAETVQKTNDQMLESASRLTRVLEMSGVPIGAFEINLNTETVFVTEQFYDLLQIPQGDRKIPYSVPGFTRFLGELTAFPEPEEQYIYRLTQPEERLIRLKTYESDRRLLGVVMDVTDEILEKRQIRHDRDMDNLTGLLNRKGFQWRFEEWRKSQETGTAGLLMFDLDNLKQVNDVYGHHSGDKYILAAVESLKQMASEEKMLLGRRSGDEFVLLLHGFSQRKEIINCLTSYFQNLGQYKIAMDDGTAIPVMISGGLKWIEGETETYEELLHYADEAMYYSKRNGKNKYTEYTG